jgi:regulatory protein
VATSKRLKLARADFDPLDARAARVAALDSLARRDRPCEDLRRKLREKGFDPAIVDEVLTRLCAEKLVDDRRYVENFVDVRAGRGHGPVRVRAELRELGLPEELAEEGIRAYSHWPSQILKARQKKFGARLPTDYADRQRQVRFLIYRGFTGAQIRLALGIDTDIDADS